MQLHLWKKYWEKILFSFSQKYLPYLLNDLDFFREIFFCKVLFVYYYFYYYYFVYYEGWYAIKQRKNEWMKYFF